MDTLDYLGLIKDAEYRIGSYVAQGGSSEDDYVKQQIEKIQEWTKKAATEIDNDEDDIPF